MERDAIEVQHNQKELRFEAHVEGEMALIQYWREGNKIIYVHTEVPEALEGRGIASAMAVTALEYAEENDLQVVARCPFVRGYIQRHPEYTYLTNPRPKKKPFWKFW